MPTNLWRIEDEQLRLGFHAGQSRAWRSTRRFVFVFAGSQGGKTTFGPWWLWREIQQRGAGDYLSVTASYDLFKLKMLPVMRETFEHVLRVGRYWSGDRILELRDPASGKFLARRVDDPMWGRVILRSAESGGGLESATAQAAWLDECGQDAVTLETWEAVQRRLSLSQGRALGTTTIYNLGWLKTEVYERWLAGDPDYAVVQFKSIVNPSFPRAEFERMKRKMQTARFKMFYEGEFARPPGLIYADFDDQTQVVEPFEISPVWPRWVGVDFGAVNTALVWLAEDPDTGRLYLYRESLEGGKTSAEHAHQAKQWTRQENVVGVYGGAPSEDQPRRDWTAAGLEVQRPPIGDVEAGIDRVTALFKERRLFIFRSCRGMLDEIGSYKRKTDASGQTMDEIENKRLFHRLDALRYVAIGLRSGAASFVMSYR